MLTLLQINNSLTPGLLEIRAEILPEFCPELSQKKAALLLSKAA